ncbi:hypothetical protein [Emticicia agri]|uniref:Polysaccharide biosynthesis protein n=1 Tax=Emticicia agri TaxID=2492393 RepID=A0A4Q5LTR9_9BACT|nr:hypothetical protein [Emticicia agri]RYU92897.1 hypothetical protein EWM59_24750 [Emticicia agri]
MLIKLKSLIVSGKKQISSDYVKAIFLRYLLYAFGVIDSLIVPILLKNQPDTYSNIEYLKNAIYLFPNILLGSYSGYTYIKYNKGVDLFNVLFKIGFISSFFLAIITGIIINNYVIIFPLLFINLYTIIEQRLKVDKKFSLAFMFKPLLAIFSILIAFLNYKFTLAIHYNFFILLTFSLAFFSWSIPSRQYFFFDSSFFKIKRIELLKYLLLIKKIFTGVLASLVLGVLIFSERYIVEKFYPGYLATYSFAFNLSQIIVVLISAFSYLSNIYLGEKINNIDKNKLKSQLKVSTIGYLALFIFFSITVVLIRPLYGHFDNLIVITLLVTIGKGYYYITGIFSPIAVYKDYNTKMLITITSIFICNVSITFILGMQAVPLITILIIDSLFILSYAFYVLDIVFRRISY